MVGGLRTSDNLIWTSDEPNCSAASTMFGTTYYVPTRYLGRYTREKEEAADCSHERSLLDFAAPRR